MEPLHPNDLCPVCGYPLGFAPWNDGNPSYEICPCCGIQFGYDDAGDSERRSRVHNRRRMEWVSEGMRWWSSSTRPPEGWNPHEQLRMLETLLSQS